MRNLLSTLAVVLFAVPSIGCRSQNTAMTNPFLAPDRVPPPATRTQLPGTAQPYYPGDPVPNSPAINPPPAGYSPDVTPQPGYQAPSTYAPQPAGALPPGGWNGAAQPIPNGYAATNVLPTPPGPPMGLAPDPSILPTPPPQVSPYPNQVAVYQPQPQQQFVQQAAAIGEPREVRIRAISSEGLGSNNSQSISSDGFRPQGSSQVRKPMIADRLLLQKRDTQSNRYGFDPRYDWVRGQLQHSEETGQWTLSYEPTSTSAEDQFGGNLTVANPRVLGNLQPGDFVLLRGELVHPAPINGGATAPIYNVSVVERQRI